MIGQSVELLILDTRRGLLGRSQSKWLKTRLSHSAATWKIIMSGASFGRVDVSCEDSGAEKAGNQSKCA